jgi:hypothetical protein
MAAIIFNKNIAYSLKFFSPRLMSFPAKFRKRNFISLSPPLTRFRLSSTNLSSADKSSDLAVFSF